MGMGGGPYAFNLDDERERRPEAPEWPDTPNGGGGMRWEASGCFVGIVEL